MKKFIQLLGAFTSGGGVALYFNKFYCQTNIQAATPSTLPSNRPNEIMKYGFPTKTNLKIRQNYVISYDNRSRQPHWVFEHINKDLISPSDNSREEKFKEDTSIHKFFRSTNQDYYKSGYDRGHLSAAANHKFCQDWMDETFYLSNISPQNPQMNRNAWNNLEKYVRSLAYYNDDVYICTGPLYLPQIENNRQVVKYEVIGENHVAVPTHFFKVVMTEKNGNFELRSYLFPNKPLDPEIKLSAYYCPMELIERAAGFLIFENIPKNKFKRIYDNEKLYNKAF